MPATRRQPGEEWLVIRGAREHNLQDIDVDLPLGCFVAVTGVSGSGKSTLVNDILLPALMQKIYKSKHGARPPQDGRRASSYLDKVIDIDQSPIGRTPRSNPATYTGVFDHIRKLFAQTHGGQGPRLPARSVLSFNVKGGRCEACAGDGTIKIEMHFLPDVYVPCEVCKGARYNRDTLDITFKGKNIAEVLDMPCEEALEFFANQPAIARHMQTLVDVGLGYVRLGQPAPTLSGGEAQRVKLRQRAGQALDRPHDLPARRADHRPPLRGHPQAAHRAVPPGRPGQHGARHRAQPRRHQDRRLDHRPRAGGRLRRRHRRGRGPARARGHRAGELHRPVPAARAQRLTTDRRAPDRTARRTRHWWRVAVTPRLACHHHRGVRGVAPSPPVDRSRDDLPMGVAVRYRYLAGLRQGWRSWAVLALVSGLAAGLALTAVADARRTTSALPRAMRGARAADAQVSGDATKRGGAAANAYADAVSQLPDVTAATRVAAFFMARITPDGGFDTDLLSGHTLGFVRIADEGEPLNQVRVVQGRQAAADRPEEITINRVLADTAGWRVGQVVEDVRLFAPAEMTGDLEPDPAQGTPVRLRVVGLVEPIDDVLGRWRVDPPGLPHARRSSTAIRTRSATSWRTSPCATEPAGWSASAARSPTWRPPTTSSR